MKNIVVISLLVFSAAAACAQSKATLKISSYSINKKEVTPDEPVIISANFKNLSQIYEVGNAGGETIGVRFSLIKEGVGRDKYWVYQTEFMHKNGKRWINMCNTPRHKMKGPYHLKSYFECRYDAEGNSFAVAYEIDAEHP